MQMIFEESYRKLKIKYLKFIRYEIDYNLSLWQKKMIINLLLRPCFAGTFL
jgi:hypothetical protein